jgi:hypothetical protein
MKITKESSLSGKTHEREIDITPEDLQRVVSRGSTPIQRVVPNLSDEDREFLMTGITPEEWAQAFPPEEEDAT